MAKSELTRVFISIGHPALPTPMIFRLGMDVPDTRAAAKKLRKDVATKSTEYGLPKGLKVRPADLYWAIFQKQNDKNPVEASDNYYWKFGTRKQFGDPSPDSCAYANVVSPA